MSRRCRLVGLGIIHLESGGSPPFWYGDPEETDRWIVHQQKIQIQWRGGVEPDEPTDEDDPANAAPTNGEAVSVMPKNNAAITNFTSLKFFIGSSLLKEAAAKPHQHELQHGFVIIVAPFLHRNGVDFLKVFPRAVSTTASETTATMELRVTREEFVGLKIGLCALELDLTRTQI